MILATKMIIRVQTTIIVLIIQWYRDDDKTKYFYHCPCNDMNNMNAHKKNDNRETFMYIMMDLPEVYVTELWFNIKPVYCC